MFFLWAMVPDLRDKYIGSKSFSKENRTIHSLFFYRNAWIAVTGMALVYTVNKISLKSGRIFHLEIASLGPYFPSAYVFVLNMNQLFLFCTKLKWWKTYQVKNLPLFGMYQFCSLLILALDNYCSILYRIWYT